ncbi:MAG: DUF1850 domain-containing protein [Treponema sp.]|nr:DUF1850 domain-containing protein [Treponema sp.]
MKRKSYLFIFTLLFFLLLAGVILFTPAITLLSISNRKNPSEVYYSLDGYKKGFTLSYTHSVNKGRVHDYYECLKDGNLLINQTIFVSYGAGIPEASESPRAEFTVTSNGYKISNLQRKVDKLVMAVGIIANHSITFELNEDFNNLKTKEYFLTDYFKPQTSIILQIKKVSLMNFLLHKIK